MRSPDVLMVVAARGGSMGLPGKNVRPLNGRPMISWTIEAARRAACTTRVVLTTDDRDIASAAKEAGAEVPFMRPVELAGPDVPGVDPVLHLIEALGAREPFVCLLQPTSPLRTFADIEAAREMMSDGTDAVISVARVKQHMAWQCVRDEKGYLSRPWGPPPATRQELQQALCPNGAIYLCRTEVLRQTRTLTPPRTRCLVMPAASSVDVDDLDDFEIAEALMKQRISS